MRFTYFARNISQLCKPIYASRGWLSLATRSLPFVSWSACIWWKNAKILVEILSSARLTKTCVAEESCKVTSLPCENYSALIDWNLSAFLFTIISSYYEFKFSSACINWDSLHMFHLLQFYWTTSGDLPALEWLQHFNIKERGIWNGGLFDNVKIGNNKSFVVGKWNKISVSLRCRNAFCFSMFLNMFIFRIYPPEHLRVKRPSSCSLWFR